MDKTLYTVGDICTLTGVTRKTLFYYDKTNLLKPTALKGTQNQKLYDSEKLRKLRRIIQYRDAGLTINEIKLLFDGPDVDPVPIFREALKRLQGEMEQQKECIDNLIKLIAEFGLEDG